MIRDKALWEAWERSRLMTEPADFERNLRLLDALYEHARALGAFPPGDPLEGLESKIKLARALNVLTPTRANSPGS